MANAQYGKGREAWANAAINWGSDTIKAVLVDISGGHYTVSINSDQYLSAISSGDRIATATLASKTNTLGTLDAADLVFSAVTGSTVGAIVIYKDTGSPATSPLIAYIDTATGLPVVPNGGDIDVVWDSGSNKILTI